MFQPDWEKSFPSLDAVIHELGIEPALLADVTRLRLAAGFWIESATDTTFIVEGPRDKVDENSSPIVSSVRVFVWNEPDYKVRLMGLLCKPSWRA